MSYVFLVVVHNSKMFLIISCYSNYWYFGSSRQFLSFFSIFISPKVKFHFLNLLFRFVQIINANSFVFHFIWFHFNFRDILNFYLNSKILGNSQKNGFVWKGKIFSILTKRKFWQIFLFIMTFESKKSDKKFWRIWP